MFILMRNWHESDWKFYKVYFEVCLFWSVLFFVVTYNAADKRNKKAEHEIEQIMTGRHRSILVWYLSEFNVVSLKI